MNLTDDPNPPPVEKRGGFGYRCACACAGALWAVAWFIAWAVAFVATVGMIITGLYILAVLFVNFVAILLGEEFFWGHISQAVKSFGICFAVSLVFGFTAEWMDGRPRPK